MKRVIALILLSLAFLANAQVIEERVLGSGHISNRLDRLDNQIQVLPGVYHLPQYLPYWPTAATVWSRVVDVECASTDPSSCKGYNWTPDMGRAEYLFFRPVVVEKPEPCCDNATRVVFVETPKVEKPKVLVINKPKRKPKKIVPAKVCRP